jgi:protein required for attachment to host cells
MTMAETTWIVVADASRARVIERRGEAATELEDFLKPEGRADARNLAAEASGLFSRGGRAAAPGHGAGPDNDPSEHAVDLFAKRFARTLDDARVADRYDARCLVAPPKMLGRPRAELAKEPAGRVVQEIARDLSALDLRALLAHLGYAA